MRGQDLAIGDCEARWPRPFELCRTGTFGTNFFFLAIRLMIACD